MEKDGGCKLVDGELVCPISKAERIIQAVKSEAPSIVCASLGVLHPIAGASCVISYHGVKMAKDALKSVV